MESRRRSSPSSKFPSNCRNCHKNETTQFLDGTVLPIRLSRLRAPMSRSILAACATCRDSWHPHGQNFRNASSLPPKFSAESTLIGPWNLPSVNIPPITARVRVQCTQACMPPPWKPCRGGQGVPPPVGAKGTFSRRPKRRPFRGLLEALAGHFSSALTRRNTARKVCPIL